jgi:hypothetical protein
MNKFLIVVIALILSYAVAFRVGSTLETNPKCKPCVEEKKKCFTSCEKECEDEECDKKDCLKDCKKDCMEDYHQCKNGGSSGVEF